MVIFADIIMICLRDKMFITKTNNISSIIVNMVLKCSVYMLGIKMQCIYYMIDVITIVLFISLIVSVF